MASPGDIADDLGDTDLREVGRSILQDAAVKIGGTATTKYMRAGVSPGPEGSVPPNTQTGPGSLRRQTSRLAHSLIGARSAQPTPGSIRAAPEGIFDLSPTSKGVRLEYGSEVPYAAAHEYGFEGLVNVSTHVREQTHVFGRELDDPITVRVHAHTRQMDLPERPYLRQALTDQIDEVEAIAQDTLLDALLDRD